MGSKRRIRLLAVPGALLVASATALVGIGAGTAGAASAPRQAASRDPGPRRPSRGAVPDRSSCGYARCPRAPDSGTRRRCSPTARPSPVPRGVRRPAVGGAGGKAVPTRVVRDHNVPARQITLKPGGHTYAQLHWTVVAGRGDRTSGDCQPVANRVRLTPPDTHRQLVAGWSYGPVCQQGRVVVQPLANGSGPAY
ncbi:DUF4232 domain-containing protein [Streptomyces sp. M19]